MNLEERIAELEAAWGPDDEAVRCFREACTIQKETEARAERFQPIRKRILQDSGVNPDDPEAGSPA